MHRSRGRSPAGLRPAPPAAEHRLPPRTAGRTQRVPPPRERRRDCGRRPPCPASGRSRAQGCVRRRRAAGDPCAGPSPGAERRPPVAAAPRADLRRSDRSRRPTARCRAGRSCGRRGRPGRRGTGSAGRPTAVPPAEASASTCQAPARCSRRTSRVRRTVAVPPPRDCRTCRTTTRATPDRARGETGDSPPYCTA